MGCGVAARLWTVARLLSPCIDFCESTFRGFASIVFGSMLMWHIRDGRFGSNQLERLAAFNGMLTEWYDARPGSNRLPWICLLNITIDGWGDFSGPAIKAAMTKEATLFRRLCRALLGRWD